MLALFVLSLPRALYSGYIVEHQYGLSTQTFWAWLLDDLKELGANWVAFGLTGLVGLMLWVISRSPRRWWLWLAAATLPLLLVSTLLQPLVFDPLFNKFTPLRDPQLGRRILALAERAGIPARHVYQVDRSKQTRRYNAYVTGFGASQRIVLWDTILDGMKQDEILSIMGHEMGHYRLAHVWKGIALYWMLSFILLWASSLAMSAALRRYGARWRVRGLSDLAALPLLLATVTIASFLAEPAVNAISREIEHEADVFGIEVTRDNDAAARAFIKLASQNRSNPEPALWVKWLLYSHPPIIERVRFAVTYRPWEHGQPNRFFHPRR
jgi:Zn-dependent protease with chaperone function